MKTSLSSSSCLVLIVCWVLGCRVAALGQHDEYYANAGEARQGYWDLKTDYATRSTLIRFYAADSQLVYQESLPNQFVKLTPANVRRLDQTLARLVSNQLVSSSIETSAIPLESRLPKRSARAKAETDSKTGTPEKLTASSLTVSIHQSNQKPGVFVLLQNPNLERVVITIRSDENVILYEQITRSAFEHTFLNMSGMPAGTYLVRVMSTTKQTEQSVNVSYSSRTTVKWQSAKELPLLPKPLISHR